MSRTIYLHIGHPKTASTSIQHFLCKNKDILEKAGYSYPMVSKGATNHLFLYLPGARKEIGINWQDGVSIIKKLEVINELFFKQLEQSTYKKIIISCENFVFDIESILDRFSGYKIVAIVYFRRIDHYVESLYGELVSDGFEFRHIEEHIKSKFDSLYMSRYQCIETLSKRIGKENVIVRPFEKEQFKNGCILEDFLSSIGIEDASEFTKNVRHINSAISLSMLEFIRQLNQSFYERNYFSMAKKVAVTISQMAKRQGAKKTGSLLSYEQRMALIEQCQSLDENIARNYLHRADGGLFYEEMPTDEPLPVIDQLSLSEITAIVADFLLEKPPTIYEPVKLGIMYCYDTLMEKVKALEEHEIA